MRAASPSRFHRYLLPGIVFQSVLVGGAYATGREIVEYGAKFGVAGLWSIAAIGLSFGVITALAYEFARVTGRYDYRTFVRELIGPLWPLFDLLYVVMVVVVIAVVSAATGSIAESTLGLPYWLGVAGVVVVVAAINAAGRRVIEAFKSLGSALLYAGYAAFAGTVFGVGWEGVESAFARGDVSYTGPVGWGTLIGTGVLYAGYNLASLPSTLFVLDRQRTRVETLTAGLVTGLLSTLPFLLTYLAVMAFYPAEAVLAAEVPWLVMLERVGGGWLVAAYAVVVLWTLVETAVGMIHAVLDRISVNLVEAGHAGLAPRQVASITAAILLVAALLSRLGIIALVAQGYTLMAYGFLLLFALPLSTVGVFRIVRHRRAARSS